MLVESEPLPVSLPDPLPLPVSLPDPLPLPVSLPLPDPVALPEPVSLPVFEPVSLPLPLASLSALPLAASIIELELGLPSFGNTVLRLSPHAHSAAAADATTASSLRMDLDSTKLPWRGPA
jgi:hypothetical protein